MKKKPHEIISQLITQYNSLREFARAIQEDGSDVIRWKQDRTKVKPRAVIRICALHPKIKPHDLNPDVFPQNLTLHFGGNDE